MTDKSKKELGPGFQDAESKLYRLEYAVISLSILGFVVWKIVYGSGSFSILELVLWAIFPDLAAFIPIGLKSKNGAWPSWGANVYNLFHNIVVWSAIFLLVWLVLRTPHWELLGWLGHITTDRAVGFGLRKNESSDYKTSQTTSSTYQFCLARNALRQ